MCLGKWHIVSQCPNRRTMVLRGDGNVESESSHEGSSSSSEVKSSSDSSHRDGDLLMVRRFFVIGKLCSLIISGGSSVNVANFRLVEKLGTPTLVHPRPYKL
ncbi:hypothetical protein CR513_33208, partial [Mucuna pruriens]